MENIPGTEPHPLNPNSAASTSSGLGGSDKLSDTLASWGKSRWEQALQGLKKEDQEQFDRIRDASDKYCVVLDEVFIAVNKRKEECLKERWRLKISGRDIFIRNVLEKLCGWVKKLIAIGDIVIQYDPIHAALPWAAVRFIMQTGINDLDVFSHVILSLENIASIVAQCHVIEAVYLSGRKLKILYAAILQYLADIMQYFALGTGKRFLRSIGKSQEDFQAKYSPIKHALEDFMRLTGISQAANLEHGLNLIENIERQLKAKTSQDDKEFELLKTSIERFRQPINYIDTRLQEIQDGLKQEQRLKILKAISTISHGTHHKISRKGRIEGSGSFVRQLASVGPKQPILAPVVKYFEDVMGDDTDVDPALTTDECIEILLQLFDEYPTVTLVLDALDEVNQDCRQELLDALTKLAKQSTTLLRIFISSRSNYDIALHLDGTPNIYIGVNDNAEDISSFIDKKLPEARLLYGNLPPSLHTTIVDTLKAGAKGMFRWVELQIQSLRSLKVAADVRARLGKLPSTLEASYWEIFQQIRESGDSAFRLAVFAFQWLLYAKEPLPLYVVAALASVAFEGDPSSSHIYLSESSSRGFKAGGSTRFYQKKAMLPLRRFA
ncbi:hypothetical protein ONZ43_g3796 [Nemania bipapillata]|uniref:Uncharacterized protein n=1 Tax=Nemania bipapillata TaxID=110536 RepID=A0ACC2IVF2_9PEZI|nr:hypothetical protein ONZ43_g3796 [Nemania bipapillata]